MVQNRRIHPKRVTPRKALLLFATLMLFAPLSHATSHGEEIPKMEMSIGTEGRFSDTGFTPVRMRLAPELAQAAPVKIELALLVIEANEVRPLRRYSRLLATTEEASSEITVPVFLNPCVRYLLAEVLKDGDSLYRRRVVLLTPDDPNTLVLSSNPENVALDQMRYYSMPLPVSADKLHEDWAFYDSFEFVIVDDIELDSLAPSRFDALKKWVCKGGSLALTARGLEMNASSTRLSSLADFKVVGKKRIESAHALEDFFDEERGTVASMDILEVMADEKDIFLEEQGYPLILKHEAGSGSVWAVSFDPRAASLSDFRRFEALQAKIWQLLFMGIHEEPLDWPVHISATEEAKVENLLGKVAVYLVVLVVLLGPVNTIALRKMDKREYILATIPIAALLLGAGAFGIGLSMRGNKVSSVTRSVTIGKAGGRICDHRQYAGVMAPRKGVYRVTVSNSIHAPAHAVMPRMLGYCEKAPRFVPRFEYLDKGLQISNLEIPMWGMEFLQVLTVVEYDETISCSMNIDNGVLSGTITSGLPFPLNQCYVVFRHNKVPLGTLEPGQTKDFALEILPPPSLPEIESYWERDAIRGDIFDQRHWKDTRLDESQLGLVAQAGGYAGRFQQTPFLFGWADSAFPLQVGIRAEGARTQSHAFVFKLPLYLEGKYIEVPLGTSSPSALPNFVTGIREPEAVFRRVELDLPFNAHKEFQVDELIVHMALDPMEPPADESAPRPEPMPLIVWILDWQEKKWVDLATTTEEEIHIPVTGDPQRYVKFPHCIVGLALGQVPQEGEPAPPLGYADVALEESAGLEPSMMRYGLSVRYLDISLKGHVPED
ncbi:MAG: hypothetical protein Kow0099_02100 [Candidatus Abyssubacteria bacterium]